ncbi:hypothetical protein [Microbacterium tumbae]
MTMLDDDELTRLLVEANPARTPRDARPDDAARRMRRQIIADAPRPQRRRGVSRKAAWAGVAAAAVAGAVVVLGIVAPGGAAVAVTPMPLVFTDAGSVEDVIARADALLADGAGPETPVREVESVTWSLAVDVDEQHSEIVPQWTTLTWNEDFSGGLTVLAGEAYWPSDVGAEQAEAVPGDEVLVDMEFEPGQFNTPVVQPPGESTDDVVAMLRAFGMPADPSSGDVMIALFTALDQWTLTDVQHARLLDYLVSRGGVEMLGSTTDRLGRPVDAVRVEAERGVSDTVLLSQQTGRIVGVETEQTEGDGIIPAGAVVSYRLWDLDEGIPE